MHRLRGVVLAGGKGTRLGELTRVTNKHLLPVGLVPMICHPILKLVGAGITDICLVSGPESIGDFARLLESGSRYLCNLTYRVQDEPGGIAQALSLAEGFCAGYPCMVLLGDNIFEDAIDSKSPHLGRTRTAHILLKQVSDPERYGVVEMEDERIVSIQEKPQQPRSNFVVTGVYCYPPDVFDAIRILEPSERGELEITDLNLHYLQRGRLCYTVMNGYWTDAGTVESLVLANALVSQSPPRF